MLKHSFSHPSEWLLYKKKTKKTETENTSVGENMAKLELMCTASGNVK